MAKIGGISIPGTEGENPPPSRNQKISRFVSVGPVRMGQPVCEIVQTTYLTTDGTLIEETIVKSAACAGCGRQMKSDEAVGAMCFNCHYILADDDCLKKFTCSQCGRQACPACGSSNEDGDFVCCNCVY